MDSGEGEGEDGKGENMRTQRRATAYHEAGHTVIAYLRGFPVDSVTIIPDCSLGSSGYTHCVGIGPNVCSFYYNLAEWTCAGEQAENIKYPDSIDEAYVYACDDFDSLSECIEKANIFNIPDSELLDEIIELTAFELKKHWASVEAIAGELIKYNKLTHDEVAIIIDSIEGEKDYTGPLAMFRAIKEA